MQGKSSSSPWNGTAGGRLGLRPNSSTTGKQHLPNSISSSGDAGEDAGAAGSKDTAIGTAGTDVAPAGTTGSIDATTGTVGTIDASPTATGRVAASTGTVGATAIVETAAAERA